MKHRTLAICLFALVTLAITSVARADTFDFSFSGLVFSGSGSFIAAEEGSTSIYDIGSVAGSVKDWAGTSAITTLVGANKFNGNDNKLIYPGILSGTKFFDFSGVSFALADGNDVNLNDTWGIEYAVGGTSKGPSFAELTFIDVSKNSPVPEPSSLALFGTGILVVAAAMRKLRFV